MILVIDNYDSFTYNLFQYLGELGAELKVFRNDAISPLEVGEHKPNGIVISPGPCTPKEAGISKEVIAMWSGKIPLFGVCLGHQSMGEVFGGVVKRAPTLMHGKTSQIKHNGKDLFNGVGNPFTATRYHSLIVERETFPEDLEITAETAEGEIMGLRHKKHETFGVQFHPESILTVEGKKILKNYLDVCKEI